MPTTLLEKGLSSAKRNKSQIINYKNLSFRTSRVFNVENLVLDVQLQPDLKLSLEKNSSKEYIRNNTTAFGHQVKHVMGPYRSLFKRNRKMSNVKSQN